jgi:hypothetical protein
MLIQVGSVLSEFRRRREMAAPYSLLLVLDLHAMDRFRSMNKRIKYNQRRNKRNLPIVRTIFFIFKLKLYDLLYYFIGDNSSIST